MRLKRQSVRRRQQNVRQSERRGLLSVLTMSLCVNVVVVIMVIH